MLFDITSVGISDDDFKQLVEKIKLAYFDTQLYKETLSKRENDFPVKLRKWHSDGSDQNDAQILAQLEETLKEKKKILQAD